MFSCDTFVVCGDFTLDGRVLVAKNSDREPNEPNNVVLIPTCEYTLPSVVKCTYIEIPQVQKTNSILLLQPSWIWGGEYGTNNFGVCIGNEAVFSKFGSPKEKALLGMDLLRLGLERGNTAVQARDIIIDLLETYGQGGNCGLSSNLYYHNSFIIADRREAFILETFERFWVWKKVTSYGSISNCYSITNDWDCISPELVTFAIGKKLCTKDNPVFNFAKCFTDFTYSQLGKGNTRKCIIESEILKNKGNVTVQTCMNILRLHNDKNYNPTNPLNIGKQTICMHYAGKIRQAQTTGSFISHLAPPNSLVDYEENIIDIHWTTNTSCPCLSSFKPIIGIDSFAQDIKDSETNQFYNSETTWWLGEELHRYILLDFETRSQLVRTRNKILENQAIEDVSMFSDRTSTEDLNIYNLRREIGIKYYENSRSLMKELLLLFSKKENQISIRFGSILSLWYYWNWKKKCDSASLYSINTKSWFSIIPVDILSVFVFGVFGFYYLRKRRKL